MKKITFILVVATVLSFGATATKTTETVDDKVRAGEVEKKGVLATEACIQKGYFKDCRLDTTLNSPIALYVHSEGTIYKLDTSDIPMRDIDAGIGKNNAMVIGTLGKDNSIKVRVYKAPPPEAKSFFKGCL